MKRKSRLAEPIWFLLLAGWILMIFGQSMTPAVISSQESGRVLMLLQKIGSAAGLQAEWLTEHLVRKTAHFSEYTVFGVLLLQNIRVFRKRRGRQGRKKLEEWCFPAFFVFAVPFLDETIQLFAPGRSAQISDVWLDAAGACFGLLLCRAAIWTAARMTEKRRYRQRG